MSDFNGNWIIVAPITEPSGGVRNGQTIFIADASKTVSKAPSGSEWPGVGWDFDTGTTATIRGSIASGTFSMTVTGTSPSKQVICNVNGTGGWTANEGGNPDEDLPGHRPRPTVEQ